MIKRIIALIMVFVSIISFSSCKAEVSKEDIHKELGSENYTVVSIPCEDAENNWRQVTRARYKDNKEPITLSLFYSNRIYAAIPCENAEREIEAYETEIKEFADNDDSKYEFFVFEELSRTGVIEGNDKGEVLPFENVTRAEATAMIMRMLGLKADDNYKLTFEDVNETDWYYGVIAAANKYGLVLGDSQKNFSPTRNISREEFTVIAARAVKYAGLGYPGDESLNAKDKDKISPWAESAYSMLGAYVNTDTDNTDPENPKRIIAPQNSATRYDVADLLYNITSRCLVFPSYAAEYYGFDKGMPSVDGSTSTYPFTDAVYSALFSNGSNHPSKPSKHSKSHESYENLINGEIDMMFASVYPASDILKLAEEKGVEFELIPIAYDAMIFFTNKENTIEGLTKEQISEIYVNDAYDNWSEIGGPDALLYPYCRNNDSGSHAQMEKHFLNGNEIHKDIRSETTSIAMASVLTDVISAKTTNPEGYALGYSIYYYYHNADAVLDTKKDLKLLAIDGVYPTDETIADGSYSLSDNTYVVLRKDTDKDAPARKMAEFMLSEAGQICVENAGFGKLMK